MQPLADPRAAPGAKRGVCDPHREAQAEPDPVPWLPCPRPHHVGARGPGVFSDGAGGISQPSRAWLHGPQHPRPAPCGVSRCPWRPGYSSSRAHRPLRLSPILAGDPCPPTKLCRALRHPLPLTSSMTSFYPDSPSDGSSSRQPSWVPSPCPGPCTPSGCWGGGRAAPPGPHGCSQQAWGGQTWWLWEPPPWGRGSPVSSARRAEGVLSILDSVAGAASYSSSR